MNFERISLYCLESKEGYRVTAQKVAGGVWVYAAHGPARQRVKSGKVTAGVFDKVKGEMMFKARYALGEEVPAYREHLGAFRSDVYGSTDEAKAAAIGACEKNISATQQPNIDSTIEVSRVLPTSQPHGNAAPREISSREDVLRGL